MHKILVSSVKMGFYYLMEKLLNALHYPENVYNIHILIIIPYNVLNVNKDSY